MNEVFASFPMVECPHCGKTFQWDDYYDLANDDEHDCPHCEKTIYVSCVDTQITATLSTEPNNKPTRGAVPARGANGSGVVGG